MTEENKLITNNLITENIEDSNKNKVTLSDELISMIISFIIPKFDIKSIKYFNGENNNSTLLIFNIFNYLNILHHNKISINFVKNTYIDVFIFMKLQNTEVIKIRNRYMFTLNIIMNFVRKEKQSNNPDILVEGDNRRFRLIGDLKTLFDFIKKQMILRGNLKNPEDFPEHISYLQILKYLKYCFPVKITNNV
jgi:hypothetical protein